MSATGRPEREYQSAQREGASINAALATGIDALGLELDPVARGKLGAYVALLEKWNRTHNLTAIRDPAQIITHHLLDSLSMLPHLPPGTGRRAIDVGSGGGMPGIPLAVARPELRMTLLDSNRKKTAFLEQAAIELPLANVEVVAGRVEDFAPRIAFDAVISRAYSALGNFVAQTRHLLAPGGQWLAMKGTLPREEIAALPASVRVVATPALRVPGINAERHLVVMEALAI
ncbi:MAG: 16S rRNA (guanine(527)-N(7))-methyltransferase RsmG [Casimicrobiaceae bacterium]